MDETKRRTHGRHRAPAPERRRAGRRWKPALLALGAAGGALTGVGAAHANPHYLAQYSCDRGDFCFWSGSSYTGASRFLDLRSVNPAECVPMQHGVLAQSFANRGDQDLTVWGRVGCSKTALWRIYPGGGTFVPHAPFPVAAITVGS